MVDMCDRVSGFEVESMSALSMQEQCDKYMLDLLEKSDLSLPPAANMAITMLKIVRQQLMSMEFLPSGQGRRHLESLCSPSSARTCFSAIKHIDPTSPDRVFIPTESESK